MELVLQILGSLGGGGLIILGFSSFLAKVWLDRITKQNSFLVDKNLEAFKNQHIKDLEVLKSQYNSQLEVLKQKNIEIQIDKNNFHQISNAFYQSFFEERVKVYLELLKIKYRYFSEMEESIMTDFHDAHSTVAFSTYKEIRELINQKQFYISNDLDNLFAKLRSQASSHLKSEEMVKAQNFSNENEDYENRYAEYEKVYYDFFKENYKLLEVMFIQIEKDIADLRKRVDF